MDELRSESVGALGLTLFRPFPREAMAAALCGVRRIVVLERTLAGGIVVADLARTLAAEQRCYIAVAGLGGRPVTRRSLRRLVTDAVADALEPLTFVDLDRELIAAG